MNQTRYSPRAKKGKKGLEEGIPPRDIEMIRNGTYGLCFSYFLSLAMSMCCFLHSQTLIRLDEFVE